MSFLRLFVFLTLAGAAARLAAVEVNFWPLRVAQKDDSGKILSLSALGPLFYSGPAPGPDETWAEGVRPFYVHLSGGEADRIDVLYPLFYSRTYPGTYRWSIFDLVVVEGVLPGASGPGSPAQRDLDIWPFYFSRKGPTPDQSYHGVFPIYGDARNILGYSRLSWVVFPFYAQTEKRGTHVSYTPWPFIRDYRGAEEGFAFWPLFGRTQGPGVERHFYYLWPFGWDNTVSAPSVAPEGAPPTHEVGLIPFFMKEDGWGYRDREYFLPFFGTTDRTEPYHYHEVRYFWPFLVQGEGDQRVVSRWGPFYTHSNRLGFDSTWILWPFWRRQQWVDGDIAQTKTQFLYVFYWSLTQRSVSRPQAPAAYKRNLWPFLSAWDNGAGARQVEALSPFEAFFPENDDMRETWTPLFAVYRHDRKPTGETRGSLLWNALTWRRTADGSLASLHLGPLVGVERAPAGSRWTILGFDFGPGVGNSTGSVTP